MSLLRVTTISFIIITTASANCYLRIANECAFLNCTSDMKYTYLFFISSTVHYNNMSYIKFETSKQKVTVINLLLNCSMTCFYGNHKETISCSYNMSSTVRKSFIFKNTTNTTKCINPSMIKHLSRNCASTRHARTISLHLSPTLAVGSSTTAAITGGTVGALLFILVLTLILPLVYIVYKRTKLRSATHHVNTPAQQEINNVYDNVSHLTINHDHDTYSHLKREVTSEKSQSNTTTPVYSSIPLESVDVNELSLLSNYSVLTIDESKNTVEPPKYTVPVASSVYSTVECQERKKVTAKLLVEDSESEEKTGNETDYFDDPVYTSWKA